MVKRILVAVGDGGHADDVADLADAMARTYDAELVVLHVWEWFIPTYRGSWAPRETSREAEALVAQVVGKLRHGGAQVSGRVVAAPRGRAAKAIIQEAGALDADLIVMGSRGPSSWAALWNGSVAQQVIHDAHCPVAVAREKEKTGQSLRRQQPAAVH
jgi:nucleotide-binding universal stress UspA family protein